MTWERTTCACPECVACCKRQPGPLAPGDFERIAAALGEDREAAKLHFWASPGALVADSRTGRQFRIGTITPRATGGRCVFLGPDDRCQVHAVAPFGCAFFDMHMPIQVAWPRAQWLAQQQIADNDYQRLRTELVVAPSDVAESRNG